VSILFSLSLSLIGGKNKRLCFGFSFGLEVCCVAYRRQRDRGNRLERLETIVSHNDRLVAWLLSFASCESSEERDSSGGKKLMGCCCRIKPIILCKTVAKHRVTRGLCEILMLLSGGLEPQELGHARSDTQQPVHYRVFNHKRGFLFITGFVI